jgi:three-Cys-motif partner protein
VSDPYAGREQTQAKHFVLERYLQELAFKVLSFSDITYVDAFCGPWEAKTEDFSDTSFMIAIRVLQDAQKQFADKGIQRRIRCFFVERDPVTFAKLQKAVAPYHQPENGFSIETRLGAFEDAVDSIRSFIGASFALIFIDPTGWTDYAFDKIGPLFDGRKCEVLINFMYDFINRFASDNRPEIIASLEPILGGPNWRERLDNDLPQGLAVEKLCRETLKAAGKFRYVVSTRIDKPTADRPHFFLIFGTKDWAGLKAFRQIEYDALRRHARARADAKERKREKESRSTDLFAGHDAEIQEGTVGDLVDEQKELARSALIDIMSRHGEIRFRGAAARLMEAFMLRETNLKDICLDLARNGSIENTWSPSSRKPKEDTVIKLRGH